MWPRLAGRFGHMGTSHLLCLADAFGALDATSNGAGLESRAPSVSAAPGVVEAATPPVAPSKAQACATTTEATEATVATGHLDPRP